MVFETQAERPERSEVAPFPEELSSKKRAAERTACRDSGSHCLGVGNFALRALSVAAGLEPVIGNAVYCGHFGVHWVGD